MQSGVHWYGYEEAASAEAGPPTLDCLDPLEYPMMMSTSALEEALVSVRSSWTSDVRQLEEMLRATEQRNEELRAELERMQEACVSNQRVVELEEEVAQARALAQQRSVEALESMRELEKLELELQKQKRHNTELQAEAAQLRSTHSRDIKELELMLKGILAENDKLQQDLQNRDAMLAAAAKLNPSPGKEGGKKSLGLSSPASTKTTTPFGGSPITPTGSVLSHTASGLMSPRSTRSMKQPLEEPEAGGAFHMLLSQTDRGPTVTSLLAN